MCLRVNMLSSSAPGRTSLEEGHIWVFFECALAADGREYIPHERPEADRLGPKPVEELSRWRVIPTVVDRRSPGVD